MSSMEGYTLKLLVMLLIGTLTLTGCVGGGISDKASDELESQSEGIFELTVDWDSLRKIHETSVTQLNVKDLPSTALLDYFTPTHVAARLVYIDPNVNAAFVQMTEKEQSDKHGVISMKVPHGRAVLQVVVVHHDQSAVHGRTPYTQVLYGAVLENIEIRGNQIRSLTLEELELKEFEVRWSDEWALRFDENNVAYVSKEDVEDRHGTITPMIQYTYPIHSDLIPNHLRLVNWGDAYYQFDTDKTKWDHLAYQGCHESEGTRDRYTATIPVPVDDYFNGFAVKEGNTRIVITKEFKGWLAPWINGADWNLEGFTYYTTTAPSYSVDGARRPTEFTLIWSE